MDQVQILSALRTRLQALPGIVVDRISWEMQPFSPPAGKVYWAEAMVSCACEIASIGTPKLRRWTGIYQVMVCAPADQAAMRLRSDASQLRLHFSPPLELSVPGGVVSILREPTVLPHLDIGGWYGCPVQIPFTADEMR